MNIDSNNLNFEEFQDYGSRFSRKISITKAESFGFPTAFYRENKLDRFKGAKLYFDKKNMVIGIKFIPETDEASFKIIRYGEGDKTSAGFGARSFFNKYDLKVAEIHGKYDYMLKELDGIGEVLMIQLEEKKNDVNA